MANRVWLREDRAAKPMRINTSYKNSQRTNQTARKIHPNHLRLFETSLRNVSSKHLPYDLLRSEYRPFHARPAVIPRPIFLLDLRDASKADTNPASHRRFQRYFARHIVVRCDLTYRLHHRFRTAASDTYRTCASTKQSLKWFCYATTRTERSILSRNL